MRLVCYSSTTPSKQTFFNPVEQQRDNNYLLTSSREEVNLPVFSCMTFFSSIFRHIFVIFPAISFSLTILYVTFPLKRSREPSRSRTGRIPVQILSSLTLKFIRLMEIIHNRVKRLHQDLLGLDGDSSRQLEKRN